MRKVLKNIGLLSCVFVLAILSLGFTHTSQLELDSLYMIVSHETSNNISQKYTNSIQEYLGLNTQII